MRRLRRRAVPPPEAAFAPYCKGWRPIAGRAPSPAEPTGPIEPPKPHAPPPLWQPEPGERIWGVAGWSPWSGRRVRRAAARKVEAQAQRQLAEARQAELAAQRAERRANPYLPPPGEARAQAGRSYRRLRLPVHRATSEVLAGAYPFLAEKGLGASGMLIGQDAWSGAAFCYDPWELYSQKVLTNPNIALFGQIGRGKSSLAKSLACRCIAFGRRVYVPGDPKGEWAPVARAVGGQVIRLDVGSAARLNPLDEGPQPAGAPQQEWRAQVDGRRKGLLGSLAEATLGRPLKSVEWTALDAGLADTLDRATVPVLPMVVESLLDPRRPAGSSSVDQLRDDGRDVGHALARLVRGNLAGLFDGPSTVAFDPAVPMLSLDLSGITGSNMLLGLVMTCASTWLEAALADPAGGQRLVVYDEAWRLLAQPALLARMQEHWKLSRAWGLANIMILHRLSDLDAIGDQGSQSRGLAQGLLADTATRILYAEPFDEATAAGRLLGLTNIETAQLPELAQGEGLWRVNQRAFVVRHLLTAAELATYDTDARMLDVAG